MLPPNNISIQQVNKFAKPEVKPLKPEESNLLLSPRSNLLQSNAVKLSGPTYPVDGFTRAGVNQIVTSEQYIPTT